MGLVGNPALQGSNMTKDLRDTYREIRSTLSRAKLRAVILSAQYAAEARRMERTPNGPPARADRRAAITRKHKGEV